MSVSGTALGRLWILIRKYPKAILVAVWITAVASFVFWRLSQPFDQMQPTLFSLGVVTLAIGGTSLWLEKRDQRGTRFKAVMMSATVIFIGLTLGYLGIRPI
ncbi:hypothetical protein HY502_02220 [Candidatus Woesebacteria bacterium]|nr:hypothetical protein [Candidatus Woesebacteria bacterium]